MTVFLTILSIATYAGLVKTVLPPQCLANFRWDDCGKPPQTVIYYWRVASRCEVGIWRGCLPNINMFKDEYECVTTCTFSVRASAQDFHKLNEIEEVGTTPILDEGSTNIDNSTNDNDVNSTTPAANITEGDEKNEDDKENDKDDDNKEEGPDDTKNEDTDEKDGEKDKPDEGGEDTTIDTQATTEGEPNADNENPEEEPEEPVEPEAK